MYRLSLLYNKKVLKFLGVIAYLLSFESASSSSISDTEPYVPPKLKLELQSIPYLEQKKMKPFTWDVDRERWVQELEEWEKEALTDVFTQTTYKITGPQKLEDNYHSEKEDLTAEDFEKYQFIETIGKNFLRNHSLLKSINCNNFSFVTEIGDNFLSGCTDLTTLDLSSLIYLKTIGNNFLKGCFGLMSVDLSRLSQLTTVGYNFLNDCPKIRSIHFGDDPNEFLVQKTVEFLRNSKFTKQQGLGVKLYQKYLSKLPIDLEWAAQNDVEDIERYRKVPE